MRIVAALGGNALLQRGQPMTAENQKKNIRTAALALAGIAADHQLVLAHGNGPQVGLLALQAAAYKGDDPYPLDVLGAESVGQIGYMLEQQLGNMMPPEQRFATILTQIEVDPADPAFANPTKFIGPVYTQEQAEALAKDRGWIVKQDGVHWRRVVPSPLPRRIFEINVIRMLIEQRVIVICAGGGGIPTTYLPDGSITGVEAVIDKDRAAALLAREVQADAFLILTDVDAVYQNWGREDQRSIRKASPNSISALGFPAGSMGPKVEAACEFARETGGIACIGSLSRAREMLAGEAGTSIASRYGEIEYATSSKSRKE